MNGVNDSDGRHGDLPRFSDSLLILEIVDGSTRFPLRPVNENEFLIGSSPTCDLRLAPYQPEFHSYITSDETGCRLTAAQSVSPLVVNGALVEVHQLQAGDRVQIGAEIELVVHAGEKADDNEFVPHEPEEAEISIEQLIDGLQHDLNIISAYEDAEQTEPIESLLASAFDLSVWNTLSDSNAAEADAAGDRQFELRQPANDEEGRTDGQQDLDRAA